LYSAGMLQTTKSESEDLLLLEVFGSCLHLYGLNNITRTV